MDYTELTVEELNAKQMKTDKASYEMYENTKADTIKHMREATDKNGNPLFTQEKIDEQIKLIEAAQKEVYDDFIAHGGNPDDLKKKKRRSSRNLPKIEDVISNSIMESFEPKTISIEKPQTVDKVTESIMNKDLEMIPKKTSYDSHETYDMIPLPSKGECYKTKTSKLPVSYLTAYDENMIIAPNLYRDKLIIDTMIEQKVMSNEIASGDLLEGDRDAIILFLRANGYGNEYPITVTDDRTGEAFDTVVDLSKINFKPFNLKGDVNGYFEYELPLSKDIVKFRFLSHQNNLDLQRFETIENDIIKKRQIEDFVEQLDDIIEGEDKLERGEKIKVREAIRTIEKWGNSMSEEDLLYTHSVTNRLEMSIMSINGITDRQFIKDYIRKMNVRDSLSLRNYINDNEPGLDYNVEVERPESLGGGSMKVFLQFDQFIFLNTVPF